MKDFWNERMFGEGYDELELKLKVWLSVLWIAIIVTIVLLLCSCKSVQYVPVETVKTDTMYQKVVQRDSIHVHDSVTIREKGDTVMVEHWRTMWRDRCQRDTIYRSRVDSVQVPVPIERKLTKWQTFCLDYGKVMLGSSVILLLFIMVFMIRKIRQGERGA
jgi:hypothetical protein